MSDPIKTDRQRAHRTVLLAALAFSAWRAHGQRPELMSDALDDEELLRCITEIEEWNVMAREMLTFPEEYLADVVEVLRVGLAYADCDPGLRLILSDWRDEAAASLVEAADVDG